MAVGEDAYKALLVWGRYGECVREDGDTIGSLFVRGALTLRMDMTSSFEQRERRKAKGHDTATE